MAIYNEFLLSVFLNVSMWVSTWKKNPNRKQEPTISRFKSANLTSTSFDYFEKLFILKLNEW